MPLTTIGDSSLDGRTLGIHPDQLDPTDAVLGVLMAITRQPVVTLLEANAVSEGATTITFQTDPGNFISLEIVVVPKSPGPQVIRTSLPPVANPRQYVSNVAHSPWLFREVCGIMLLIRKVASLSATEVVRSAEGHMCPRSSPVPNVALPIIVNPAGRLVSSP